jgi:Ran GTPase-activating protein (RanGAP) involved in mRNA processing and transport
VGAAFADWTKIDLSLNKLGSNLEPVVKALRGNTKLVALRLSNNEIGGSQNIALIKAMIKTHPSLIDLDLSNDDSNRLKNKLGNAGFEAIMEAMIDSHS